MNNDKILFEQRIIETEDGFRIEVTGDKEKIREAGLGRLVGMGMGKWSPRGQQGKPRKHAKPGRHGRRMRHGGRRVGRHRWHNGMARGPMGVHHPADGPMEAHPEGPPPPPHARRRMRRHAGRKYGHSEESWGWWWSDMDDNPPKPAEQPGEDIA